MADLSKVNVEEKMQVGTPIKTAFAICMFVGLLSFIAAYINDSNRAWHAYVIGLFYFTTLALGGLFFTAVQHVTKAGWSVNIRRFCESFTAFFPVAFVMAMVLFFFGSEIYSWMDPATVSQDHLLSHKASYLNKGFFGTRLVIFFLIWIVTSKMLVKNSLDQDESGDDSLTTKNVKLSIATIILFALTYSLFSVDVIMALEAHFFSTIFGVYAFAGMFQSTMAVMILIILHMRKNGQLKGVVTMDHVHDLGKYLFGFTIFWAYIAFSQFMLIWYANLPEESFWFMSRSEGGWVAISLSLIIFKFVVPFFALLPRWAKRTPNHLAAVSVLILIMQFIDIYWLVYPSYSGNEVALGFQEVGIFLGFLGVFGWVVTRFLSKYNVLPSKDPYVKESMSHHVVY